MPAAPTSGCPPYSRDGATQPDDQAAVAETARAQRHPRGGGGRRAGPGSADPLVAGLRRAGLLRLLVLHLLGRGPSYGNQLMERVGELTGGLVGVNPNTMYPLLRALEAEGLVAGEWEHPERRSRRFYRLTETGAQQRDALVSELGPRLDELAAALDVLRRELLG